MNCGTCKHWGRAEIATQKEMHKHGFGRCAMREEGLVGYELSVAKVTYRGFPCECAFTPSRWEECPKGAAWVLAWLLTRWGRPKEAA